MTKPKTLPKGGHPNIIAKHIHPKTSKPFYVEKTDEGTWEHVEYSEIRRREKHGR